MISIVVPEPADWAKPLIELASRVAPVRVFAPWAVPGVPRAAPGAVRHFLSRRVLTGADKAPGWTLVEVGLAAWARKRTDRLMSARFMRRQAVDELARRWLPASTRMVIAPSLSSRRLFSSGSSRRMVRVLVEDVPAIRVMHEDLDRAARAHPECEFLRRYRAPARIAARQEAERLLASAAIVRGALAREVCDRAGIEAFEWVYPHPASPCPGRGELQRQQLVMLAGLASARNGSVAALGLVEALPSITLLIRRGEGAEPAELLRHPRVREATRVERERLDGVEVVIAPALCEAHPAEVRLAASSGVPVVATSRALGLLRACKGVREIALGDTAALAREVQDVLGRSFPPASSTHDASFALEQGLRALLAAHLEGARS